MKPFQHLITGFITNHSETTSRDDFIKAKRQWSKDNKQSKVPTNMQILKTYFALVEEGSVQQTGWFEKLLKKRSIRSQSGIVAVQVLTKPFWCPGKCIFCPNDATMPKSYINTQPGAMRALLNNFDPYKQVYNRLLSLKLTGHDTDKIEMIVLGGTRDVYPTQYKIDFIKGLYDACNTFQEYLRQVDIDYTNPKAARVTSIENLTIEYPDTIEESITINETATQRIIGLTVETRPEYVTDENCQLRRQLGITRMEMGIQTLHDHVHEANVRGHGNDEIRQAMYKLRQYGFKISNHYMPGLYQSTPEQDLETFQIAFRSPWIKSDELKFYPTAVIPNTPLYDLWKSGEYQPIADDKLKDLIKVFYTQIMPPYARIKRLARDFDTNEVVAGANTPNLRQLVTNEIQEEYRGKKEKGRENVECRMENTEKGQTSRHSGLDPESRESGVDEGTEDYKAKSMSHGATSKCSAIAQKYTTVASDHTSIGSVGDVKSNHNVLHLRQVQYSRLGDVIQIAKLSEVQGLIGDLQPLGVTTTSSTGRDYDDDDRIVTRRIGNDFDTTSVRSFVCLCTRSREIRNKSSDEPTMIPVLTGRMYRSSNGIEMFLSFEDDMGYLYGFTRLLLPDEGTTIDYPGLGEGTAMIRELHVYGQLQSVGGTIKGRTAQHKGLGTQLLQAAETISGDAGYHRLSVISGVGVRKYYEKKGYHLEGTYMVKHLHG